MFGPDPGPQRRPSRPPFEPRWCGWNSLEREMGTVHYPKASSYGRAGIVFPMTRSAIRHLAILDDPAILAAAYFEKTVQIWSWNTREQIGEFKSILDFGGRRLALTPDGRKCIVGSFSRGLAAYSIPDGKLLWHRRDLRKVQYVNVCASGSEIFCGVERPAVQIIGAESGESLGEITRADRVTPSYVGPHRLVIRREKSYTVLWAGKSLEIPAISFSLLSAAFSAEAVCLSEPRTGIRCIDLASGSVLWHLPNLGANEVAFNKSDQRFYCYGGLDAEPFKTDLIRLANGLIDCDTIDIISRSHLGVFTSSGSVLANADGEIYETSSGNLLSLLEFPQLDTPG